ncbi:uncharacterized protein LOC124167938 [Ischnura elegans]|uniref:uncharacterized protein LOC124167938 n=1 Tax=Ischnura elegans TaxID=197161 RepID=UPI001ED8BE91|nr:uncharacterized protein LOC124167938 [Ischnura elegans]
MDRTPKAGSKFHAKVKKSGIGKSPHRITPESSASKKTPESASFEFSPVNSPSRYDRLSQDIQVFWAWKSPDEIPSKKGVGCKTGRKNEGTPSRLYASPKPKRKFSNRNYSDKLRSLADELKSLTEGLTSSNKPGSVPSEGIKVDATDAVAEAVLSEELGNDFKEIGDIAISETKKPAPETETVKASEEEQQDVFIVELSPGDCTSLKSFPPGHKFPKVPKINLESAMNTSDFTVLMEDSSMEEEMMRFTQQMEEELITLEKLKGNMTSTPNAEESPKISAVNKKLISIKTPKTPSSGPKSPSSPAIGRRSLSLKKNSPSPAKRSGRLKGNVLWNGECNLPGVVKLGSVVDEDVTGMLADDSLDNLMLEMVVQGEPKEQFAPDPRDKENTVNRVTNEVIATRSPKADGDPKDSLGMLEDDSLSKPDVLNFLDTVESQAIAASQPIKCTPEEIKMKMVEAKKKLALARRKRRIQMKNSGVQPVVLGNQKQSKCAK